MRARRVAVWSIVGVVVIAAAVTVWLLLLAPAPSTPNTAQSGALAPQITLPMVGGGVSNLTADRGKVVLLNYWATWCEPCKAEMPALQRLADELRDRPFILYSIDLQEDAPQVEAFQRQYGLRLNALLDENGDVVRLYGVRALPSTFLIDKQGVLRLQRIGQLPAGGPETVWSDAWLGGQVRTLLAAS
jgi:thiol-disulfide isomerase/thioredoxin